LYRSVTLLFIAASSIEAFSSFRAVSLRPLSTTTRSKAVTVDRSTSTVETEHLIDEEMVTDSASASALADRCMAEAERWVLLFFYVFEHHITLSHTITDSSSRLRAGARLK
jgi:hypothetical protein